ncbi:peptidylprolyl isomerase [Glaciecola sp. 2405UD65-10]|jgi:peptidyl-prolyl cis-trans isomerase A (cyclophilin A)|uniref:peptidylprolyl isomerase n=1 Tax=Glaciecola sp. 2405UD65-10 TaxID=3397244 RepID=UPI003B59EF6C
MRQFFTLFLLVCIASLNPVMSKAKEKPRMSSPIGEAVQRDNYYPKVKFETNMGNIVVELRRDRAPITVNNFLTYVREKEYDNTLFHRIVADYIVQGGGYDLNMKEKKSNYAIINESGNGLKNDAYTISMARMTNPHSAKRQFFFNMKENDNLNPSRTWGYTVFGEVMEGQEVLDAMAGVAVHVDPDTGLGDSPVEDVILKRVSVIAE